MTFSPGAGLAALALLAPPAIAAAGVVPATGPTAAASFSAASYPVVSSSAALAAPTFGDAGGHAGQPSSGGARAPTTASSGGPVVLQGWVWPITPLPEVTRPFGVGPKPWSPGHRGADLRAAAGQVIRAPGPGRVALARVIAGRPVLVLEHGDGLRTTYEPVVAALSVGSPVSAGESVGHLADVDGHCRPGRCLHWGALHDGQYVDPLGLLGLRRPIALLPMN